MTPIDLDQASGILLAISGVVLQYTMRQFSKVPEFWYHVAAIALTFICFWLVVRDWPRDDMRDSAIVMLIWIAGHLAAVWGGTFAASNAAKSATSSAAENGKDVSGSMLVPMTDSK